jgi:DNA-binding CsgD family transcriptional regulator
MKSCHQSCYHQTILQSQAADLCGDENINLSNILQNIASMVKLYFNPDDYNFIPTIFNREKIAIVSKDLYQQCGFDRFAILIKYNNHNYWLSNNYQELTIPYHVFKLQQLDVSLIGNQFSNQTYYFPDLEIHDPLYQMYKLILNDIFNLHLIYTLNRSCAECNIFLFAINTTPIGSADKMKLTYRQSYHAFESFIINLLDEMILSFTIANPSIKNSRLFYDSDFRKRLIKNQFNEVLVEVTPQEIACLHWSSFGKTAIEIGLILNISPYTVRQHLKSAIKKLNSANITQAVYKAKCLELI